MFTVFGNLFRKQSHDPALDQLRRDIGTDPSTFPVEDLRPVMIPSPILAHEKWIGPKHYFASLPVSLTWAYLRPENTMVYLAFAAAAELESRGVDWRSRAREAAQRYFVQPLWTHEFTGESGVAEAVALLHADGLGPSRLMCLKQLKHKFPRGFSWSVPERSCAFVISKVASIAVRAKVVAALDRCYDSAEVPMSKEELSDDQLSSALEGVYT